MREIILQTIEKHHMLTEGDHVLLGLSGGADSVALLHVLLSLASMYRLTLSAVHIHHGIRDTAHKDLFFCAQLCEKKGIAFYSSEVNIPEIAKRKGLTLEEAGRQERYRIFDKTQTEIGATKIAVGHHQNDLAETIFMRLFRGTGLKGLSGIAPVRGNIIRPLLYIPKNSIVDYCLRQGLTYCQDETNEDNSFTRNKIRNTLIPYLEKEFDPALLSSLTRMAETLREDENFLEDYAVRLFEAHDVYQYDESIACHKLSISKLSEQPLAIQRRFIRLFYNKATNSHEDLSLFHVAQVLSLIDNIAGKEIQVAHGIVFQRAREWIVVQKHQFKSPDFSYPLEIDTFFPIPERNIFVSCKQKAIERLANYTNLYTKYLKYDRITSTENVVIRTRLPHDKIYIPNVGHKSLKKFFSDKKIDRMLREQYIYIACGFDILEIIEIGHENKGETMPIEELNSSFDTFAVQIWEGTEK